MPLEDYARPLAEALGLPEVQITNDACQFTIAEKLTIVIEVVSNEGTAHFYAVVAEIPSGNTEAWCAKLLEAQLFHKEMGERCCFGLDQSSGLVYLNSMFSLSAGGGDEDEFISALHEFANWAERWQDVLAQWQESSSVDDGASSSEEDSTVYLRV